MLSPQLGKVAFVWAVFITLISGLMLLGTEPGSPGFAISAIMLGLGVVFGAVVVLLVRLLGR